MNKVFSRHGCFQTQSPFSWTEVSKSCTSPSTIHSFFFSRNHQKKRSSMKSIADQLHLTCTFFCLLLVPLACTTASFPLTYTLLSSPFLLPFFHLATTTQFCPSWVHFVALQFALIMPIDYTISRKILFTHTTCSLLLINGAIH